MAAKSILIKIKVEKVLCFIIMPRIEYAIMKLHKDQHYFNKTSANSRFAKAGVPRFYESEVLNSSSVHLMKLSTKNPRLRKAAKRYMPF
jgi:hypothetical protein